MTIFTSLAWKRRFKHTSPCAWHLSGLLLSMFVTASPALLWNTVSWGDYLINNYLSRMCPGIRLWGLITLKSWAPRLNLCISFQQYWHIHGPGASLLHTCEDIAISPQSNYPEASFPKANANNTSIECLKIPTLRGNAIAHLDCLRHRWCVGVMEIWNHSG